MKKSVWFALSGVIVPLMLLAAVGCQSLWTGTVTLTKAVDAASKEYASLFNQGLVPPDVAAKASVAHQNYRKAAGVAHDALVAYKLDPTKDFKTALNAARDAATGFVDVLVPLLTKQRATELRLQISNAKEP